MVGIMLDLMVRFNITCCMSTAVIEFGELHAKIEIVCTQKKSSMWPGRENHSRQLLGRLLFALAPGKKKTGRGVGSQASASRTAPPPTRALPLGRGPWLRLGVSIGRMTSFCFFQLGSLLLPPSLSAFLPFLFLSLRLPLCPAPL